MDTRYADPLVCSEGRYIVAFDIHIYNFPKIIITYKYTCRVKLQNGRKSELFTTFKDFPEKEKFFVLGRGFYFK